MIVSAPDRRRSAALALSNEALSEMPRRSQKTMIALASRAAEALDVKAKIEAALQRRAEIEARNISVTVRDGGFVVLEGTVDNWDERQAVASAAWSAPGVRSVEDHLVIVP